MSVSLPETSIMASEDVLERYDNLLDRTDAELQGLYEMLSDLSDRLDPTASWTDGSDDLSFRLAIAQVQHHVLAARHDIHGCITQVVLARVESARRRPPP
jgi:hypothetical protein